VGDEWNLGGALSGLGDAARAQERFGPALLYFQESLLIHHWSQRNVISVTEVLRRLAQVLVALGDMQQAVRFFGYAEARREHMGVMLFARHRLAYEQTIAEARAALGEEQFQASWEEGRSLSLAEAVEAAANIRIDPKPGPD
jgi:tetratricopeptide (TPR) repeat protein